MRWSPLVVVVSLVGCGPRPIDEEDAADAAADLICGLRQECDCSEDPECDEDVSDAFSELGRQANSRGLTYDRRCMGELVAKVEAQGCQWAEKGGGKDSCLCKPYYGTRSKGQSCLVVSTVDVRGLSIPVDTCDAKGVCRSEQCVPRCWTHTGLPEGEPCSEDSLDCGEGTSCTGQTCSKEPAPGEPCELGRCELGAFCNDDLICTEQRGQGETCDDFRQCESEYCPNGTCQPLPGFGEECFGGCEPGLACVGETCTALVCGY